MHKRVIPIAITLFGSAMTGCNWISDGSSDDATVGDAATVDIGEDTADASDDRLVSAVTPRPSNNPQRAIADPYYLVGETLPEWELGRWANELSLNIDPPITLEKLRGRVVVVRFWTDASEACARTMPALQRLAEEFRNEPVAIIGVYFFSGAIVDDVWADAQARARQWGVTFPIAEDHRTLNDWWLSRFDNLPLMPTLVIGPDGRVVHVHPGPEFFPSSDPTEQLCDRDYRALRASIIQALDRQVAETKPSVQ